MFLKAKTHYGEVSVKSESLKKTFGSVVLDNGFSSIPNMFYRYASQLKIKAERFEFISRLFSLIDFTTSTMQADSDSECGIVTKKITDSILSMDKNKLPKIKRSLESDGFIVAYREVIHGNQCTGTRYDLTPLVKRLEALRNLEIESEMASVENISSVTTAIVEEQKVEVEIEDSKLQPCFNFEESQDIETEVLQSHTSLGDERLDYFIDSWNRFKNPKLEIHNICYVSEIIEIHNPSNAEIDFVCKKFGGQNYKLQDKMKYLEDRFRQAKLRLDKQACKLEKKEKFRANKLEKERVAKSQSELFSRAFDSFKEYFKKFGTTEEPNDFDKQYDIAPVSYDENYLIKLEENLKSIAKALGASPLKIDEIKEKAKEELLRCG